MSTANFQKRRALNLSINRALQLHMIRRIGMILLLSLLVSSAIYYFFADREITASYQLFHVHARNFLEFLLPVVIAAFGISLVLGAIAAVLFPRTIAGGLYGIERDVCKVADGDLTVRVTLRKGDAVHDLAAEINRMVAGLHGRLAKIEQGVEQAQGVCSSGEIGGAGLAGLRSVLDEVRGQLRSLKLSS